MALTGYGRKCPITIDHTKVSADQSNFPALFTEANLPSEMMDADGSYCALNGGGDIRFSSDSDGNTQLALEVASFVTNNDPASAKAELWVKIPSLSSASDTTVYVWYDKDGDTQPAATDTYGKYSVYDSNYVSVWHMNDATTSTITNSKANDTTLNKLSANNPQVTSSGKIGSAQTFSSDYARGNKTGLIGTGSFTISAWIKAASASSLYLITETDNNSGLAGVGMYVDTDNTLAAFTSSGVDSAVSVRDGTYKYCVFTRNFNVARYLYINGTQYTFTDNGTSTINYNYVNVGCRYSSTYYFDGEIDEVRYSNAARSATWISTEYANQNSPSTFATEGTPVSASNGQTISLSDTMTMTDSITVIRGLKTSISDTINVTENISAFRNILVSISDTIGLTDFFSFLNEKIISVVDAISMSEAVTSLRNRIISLSDNIGLSDAISNLHNKVVRVSDSIGLAEAINMVRSLVTRVTDYLGITEWLKTIGTELTGTKVTINIDLKTAKETIDLKTAKINIDLRGSRNNITL